MSRTRKVLAALVVLAAWLAVAATAQACPMCKEAIPTSDAQAPAALPVGFNTSIYYMLGALFAVMAGFGTYIVRTIRAADRQHESAHGAAAP
jgi:hypothetical protein